MVVLLPIILTCNAGQDQADVCWRGALQQICKQQQHQQQEEAQEKPAYPALERKPPPGHHAHIQAIAGNSAFPFPSDLLWDALIHITYNLLLHAISEIWKAVYIFLLSIFLASESVAFKDFSQLSFLSFYCEGLVSWLWCISVFIHWSCVNPWDDHLGRSTEIYNETKVYNTGSSLWKSFR